jgi:transcriptional regulator with XRE-family HTH domain
MAKASAPADPAAVLAERVIAYREKHSLTRQELAEQMGVHPTRVGRIERAVDSPSLDTIARVAALIGREITVSVLPKGAERAHVRKRARGRADTFKAEGARVTVVVG